MRDEIRKMVDDILRYEQLTYCGKIDLIADKVVEYINNK